MCQLTVSSFLSALSHFACSTPMTTITTPLLPQHRSQATPKAPEPLANSSEKPTKRTILYKELQPVLSCQIFKVVEIAKRGGSAFCLRVHTCCMSPSNSNRQPPLRADFTLKRFEVPDGLRDLCAWLFEPRLLWRNLGYQGGSPAAFHA